MIWDLVLRLGILLLCIHRSEAVPTATAITVPYTAYQDVLQQTAMRLKLEPPLSTNFESINKHKQTNTAHLTQLTQTSKMEATPHIIPYTTTVMTASAISEISPEQSALAMSFPSKPSDVSLDTPTVDGEMDGSAIKLSMVVPAEWLSDDFKLLAMADSTFSFVPLKNKFNTLVTDLSSPDRIDIANTKVTQDSEGLVFDYSLVPIGVRDKIVVDFLLQASQSRAFSVEVDLTGETIVASVVTKQSSLGIAVSKVQETAVSTTATNVVGTTNSVSIETTVITTTVSNVISEYVTQAANSELEQEVAGRSTVYTTLKPARIARRHAQEWHFTRTKDVLSVAFEGSSSTVSTPLWLAFLPLVAVFIYN